MRIYARSYLLTLLSLLTTSIVGQNISYYTISKAGGLYNAGAIFKLDSSVSSCTELTSFYQTNFGALNQRTLTHTGNNEFYGLSRFGGRSDGNIFKYNANLSTYVNLYNFLDSDSSTARHPFGSLIKASNGRLYGLSNKGGDYNFGTLFEYDLANNVYRDLFHFNDTLGKNPTGTLVQHPNGKLYGFTASGGFQNYGVIFEFDIVSENFQKKLDLYNYQVGLHTDNVFTLTSSGKLFSQGVKFKNFAHAPAIFEYDISMNTLLVHYSAIDSINTGGASLNRLQGKLVEDTSGMLYGVDAIDNKLFRFNPYISGIDTVYTLGNGSTIGSPLGIEMGMNNKIYGSAARLGATNEVNVFEFDLLTDSTSVIYRDTNSQHITKIDIGTTNNILFTNSHQIIEIDPRNSSSIVKLEARESIDGNTPTGELCAASNGKLYGVTGFGGTFENGVLFEYDIQSNSRNTLVHFNFYTGSGFSNIVHNLVEGSPGKLYGTARDSISSFIFEYDFIQNILNIVSRFPSSYSYQSHFIKHSNGNLYGTVGSSSNNICIYKFNPSTGLITISQECYLDNKLSSFINHINNNIYFTTEKGGQFNQGRLYEYNPNSDSLRLKHNFQINTASSNKIGKELVSLSNNKILGYSTNGGNSSRGSFFEYDLVLDTLIEVFDFDSTTTGEPIYIKKLSNNKVVGYTRSELFLPNRKFGKLFEYEPILRTVTEKYSFNRNEAQMGPLTEVNTLITKQIIVQKEESRIKVGPNPMTESLFIQFPSAQKASIKIVSISGQVIYENFNAFGDRFIINLNAKSGVYFVSIISDSIHENRKIIKLNY